MNILGKDFKNLVEACEFYKVKLSSFYYFKKANNIEDNDEVFKLLLDRQEKNKNEHDGLTFNTRKEMCDHFGISYDTYYNRIRMGWKKEDALNIKVIVDHEGNEFKTIKEMCRNYDISVNVFNARLKRNWSLERSLTEPLNKKLKADMIELE